MPRHLDDHQNLNSSRIYSSGSSTSLPLNSTTSSNTTTRTDVVDSRVGSSSSIPVTTGSAGTLPTVNVLPHHPPNRTANTPLSQGHAIDGAKPVGQRQPLALIQETVRSVGSVTGAEMQTSVQYSQPSGYPSRVAAAATTLSQASHLHNQNPSQHHHPHPGQVQAHSAQVLHSSQPNSQSNATQVSGHQFQRLKVEDALSYLDQVKYKFGNQPQVYNDFLDIMKEFKSQSIDTPGVIQRVSTLFKGHPELIVGFNTFLPPGYRIEVQSNEQVQVSIPGTNLGTGTATGPTSLTINPGGTITTQPLHTPHGSQLNHMSHSASPHHSTGNIGNKSLNHQPPITNSQVLKETSQNQIAFNQNSPANTHSSGASPGVHSPNSVPPANQPVEFNHAISYVNKIKNRFQGQPDIYKQFLEILHTYQKEQRNLKDGVHTAVKPLTEAEVYAQVAKLFQNQEDLLQEFGQFLPDANGAANALVSLQPPKTINNDHPLPVKKPVIPNKPTPPPVNAPTKAAPVVKRPSSSAPSPPIKKLKMTSLKDVSLSEAGKHGSLNEYAFFDKVRKAFKSQEMYENFLRLLFLYNQEIISRADLVQLIAPFLSKFPDLFKWFKDFLGYKDCGNTVETLPNKVANTQERERVVGDFATEIDYSSCKKYGASYRAVPKNYVQPKCSGRADLDEKERQVLNDTWVSFPSWSEDSTFVSSRKTQYEEYIYRCEDERFELDVVLDSNLSTIHALEAVQSKIDRMSTEEKAKFRLDDTLGGNSTVIHQRAIKRLYGDKAPDVIEGLKKNPVTAVPLVLKRLKAKEEEWRRAQKSFNKMWRDQNEKYYLKSLDHQGISFKQNDVKYLRSKSLLNEIENIYEERHEQADDCSDVPAGPHIVVTYNNKDIIKDSANLIIHHVKRQTGMHKEDKQKIKHLMRQFIPDLYGVSRGEMSDDEVDNDDMEIDDENENSKTGYQDLLRLKYGTSNHDSYNCAPNVYVSQDASNSQDKSCPDKGASIINQNANLENSIPGDSYSLFFVNNNWYIFFRLHYILCERLGKIYDRSQAMLIEELKDRKERKKSTAIALRLKPKNSVQGCPRSFFRGKSINSCGIIGNIAVEEYYATFLDMIKSLLDQNIDANQYEDTLREMFGIEAYWAFTLEKVVQNVVRQLQHIVGDDSCTQCTSLFMDEQKNRSTGGLCATSAQRSANEMSYQKKAEQVLTDENCYKVIIYKNEGKLTIELLDSESDQLEEPNEPDRWSHYFDNFKPGDPLSNEVRERITKRPVFLPRNARTRRQKAKNNEDKSAKIAQDEQGSPSYMADGDLDSKIDLSCLEDSTAGDAVKGLVGLNSKSLLIDKGRSKVSDDSDNRSGCKFNVNSYKLVFVVHSECFLYTQNSLLRARQFHKKVSCKLNKHFHSWHKKWLKENVSEEDTKKCVNWLIGNTEDSKPTVCVKVDNPAKPPYYCYNRYHVQKKT